MKVFSLIPLVLFAALSQPTAGQARIADVICDDKTRLEERLTRVQGAVRQGQGMRGPDALMEIWITPHNGDWTLVQSYAGGTACIVAMGEHWEMLTPRDPA